MNTTVKGLTPLQAYAAWLAIRADPILMQGELPFGAPVASGMASATGSLTLDLPERTELLLMPVNAPNARSVRICNGFTKQIPRLDSLVPSEMASGSGDQVLEVHGVGLSMSNELYFGWAGQGEPVRPKDQKIITTIIKTDLWAPGEQPVWVINAGTKSNVLMFTFT